MSGNIKPESVATFTGIRTELIVEQTVVAGSRLQGAQCASKISAISKKRRHRCQDSLFDYLLTLVGLIGGNVLLHSDMWNANLHELLTHRYIAQFCVEPNGRHAGVQDEMNKSPPRKILSRLCIILRP